MPFAEAAGLRVYYQEHGAPDGPPLVLLHGFSGTSDAWSRQLAAFSADYRLIVPDMRGHGRTANPDGPPAMHHRQFARDVVALCTALRIERAAFCGHSSGAMLLLTLGLEAPALANVLILASDTYFYSDALRAWWREQTPETVVPAAARPARQAAHAALGPEHWRTLAAAWIALGQHAHGEDFPAAEEIGGISAPTLIVHGDRDQFFPVEVPAQLYRLLPNAELCLLPNTGHGVPRERPDWFNAVALDFLARRLRR